MYLVRGRRVHVRGVVVRQDGRRRERAVCQRHVHARVRRRGRARVRCGTYTVQITLILSTFKLNSTKKGNKYTDNLTYVKKNINDFTNIVDVTK